MGGSKTNIEIEIETRDLIYDAQIYAQSINRAGDSIYASRYV